jgi:O-antigen/teichoic acid export membrane protein
MLALEEIRWAIKERLSITVISNFFVYAAGKIAMSGISIVMAPIMMILLSPAEYGLLSLIHSFNNIAIAFIGFGLPQVLMIEYFRATEQHRAYALNSIMITFFVCSMPIMCACFLYPSFIRGFLYIPQSASSLVYAVILICFFSFCNDILFQVLQYHYYAVLVTMLQLSMVIGIALINIVSIGYYHCSVAAVVWGECCVNLVLCSIGFFLYVKNRIFAALDRTRIKKQIMHNIKRGIPLLSSVMACWFFGLLNRWMVIRYAGLKEAGILAVADAGGLMVYRLVLHPLQGSYGPALFDSFGKRTADIYMVEKSNQKVMCILLVVLLALIVLSYGMLRSVFYYIVPSAYALAVDCLLGVLIGYIFLIGSYFVSNVIQFQKKRLIFVVALIIAASINVLLNLMFIPSHGLSGCIFAMMVGYGSYFLVLLVYNRFMLRKLVLGHNNFVP